MGAGRGWPALSREQPQRRLGFRVSRLPAPLHTAMEQPEGWGVDARGRFDPTAIVSPVRSRKLFSMLQKNALNAAQNVDGRPSEIKKN